MKELRILVGDILKSFPSNRNLIEWSGSDIFLFSFFDDVSMKRTHVSSAGASNGCFLIPRDVVGWLRCQKLDSILTMVIYVDDGYMLKCMLKDGCCTQIFRCNVECHTSIEWEDKPCASVNWTCEMNDVVKCLFGVVHVDMHRYVKFSCGNASAVVEVLTDGECSCYYDSDLLQKVDIIGKMCIHKSRIITIKDGSVVYLIAPYVNSRQ